MQIVCLPSVLLKIELNYFVWVISNSWAILNSEIHSEALAFGLSHAPIEARGVPTVLKFVSRDRKVKVVSYYLLLLEVVQGLAKFLLNRGF